MIQETFQRHAGGLLDRLRAALAERGVDTTNLRTSSQITGAALERAAAFNPDASRRTPDLPNEYDILLSQFSSDLYNLMMNYAIRNLPPAFDQLAMVLRNGPESDTPT